MLIVQLKRSYGEKIKYDEELTGLEDLKYAKKVNKKIMKYVTELMQLLFMFMKKIIAKH